MEKTTLFTKNIMKSEENCAIIKFTECDQTNFVYHSHDFLEICYVVSGYGYHLINDTPYKVTKGDLFIINQEVHHAFYKESSEVSLLTYNIAFTPDFLDDTFSALDNINVLHFSNVFKAIWNEDILKADIHLSAEEQTEFSMLLNDIYTVYISQETNYLNIMKAYVTELLLKLLRTINKKMPPSTHLDKQYAIVETAMLYLNEHYQEKYSLEEICQKFYFSKSYFSKLFKAYTKMTILEYTQHIRIEEACKLIRTSNKKITDIALEVGFKDYKSFTILFKRIIGMKPMDYKKLH